MPANPTVAVLGTGTMGAAMARNLAAAGLPLRVWNRNPARAEPLVAAGATLAASVADAVAGADVVLTMLWDADSVAEVIEQAGDALTAGTIWVQACTVGAQGQDRLARLAARRGLVFVDAPVLGTRKPAEDGTLVVLASGPDEVRPVLEPVFAAIGGRTVWAGSAGAGSRLKLVTNAWVLTVLEGLAECLALAERLDLDPALFLEAVRGGAMDAPYLAIKGQAMLTGDYTPSFTVDGAAKDADLVMAAARDAGADVGVLAAVCEHLHRAVAAGYGDLDMAATFLPHRV